MNILGRYLYHSSEFYDVIESTNVKVLNLIYDLIANLNFLYYDVLVCCYDVPYIVDNVH